MSISLLLCLFHHFQFTLIHGPNIPGSYAVLFFTALDFTSITSHMHNWALFLFWLHLFILSGVISPLFSSSILGTYWPGEFIFRCHTFLNFHTVHEVLRQEYQKGLPLPCFVFWKITMQKKNIYMAKRDDRETVSSLFLEIFMNSIAIYLLGTWSFFL